MTLHRRAARGKRQRKSAEDLDIRILLRPVGADPGIVSVAGGPDKETLYYVHPLTGADASFGACYRLAKFETCAGTDTTQRSYDVSLGKYPACTCWGEMRWRKACRHIRACVLLESEEQRSPSVTEEP